MVVRLSLYTSQSPRWHLDCPFTHHCSLVVLKLSLHTSQSPWWYSEYPFTHHNYLGGTQTILILITILIVITIPVFITAALVVLGLSLYSSQSLWWSSVYPHPHHILFGCTQSILYASQSLWWYSEYPYTHHSLPGGTQTNPILITVFLRVLRLSL